MTDQPNIDQPNAENDQTATTTWRLVVDDLEAQFVAAGVSLPDLSARRIAEEASGLSGVELELSLEAHPTKRMMSHLDAMALRRLTGEPLQYVVGNWGFRTLDVMVDKRVLIPRPETEEVVGWALEEIDRLAQAEFAGSLIQAVDLGTGSGVIGMSLVAEREGVEVTLTDAAHEALDVARANCAGLGVPASRIVGIRQGSWFDALSPDLAGQLGVVVSNPPYVAEDNDLPDEVADWEPSSALLAPDRGFAHVTHILSESPRWLHQAGAVVVEMAPAQVAEAALLATEHFSEVEQLVDQFGRERAVRARRKLR